MAEGDFERCSSFRGGQNGIILFLGIPKMNKKQKNGGRMDGGITNIKQHGVMKRESDVHVL